MKDTTDIAITGYSCPLCGKWHDERYYYVRGFPWGPEWYYDRTPCCRVVVAWLKTEGLFVYVGTFRNPALAEEWFTSAGSMRRDIDPVGSQWDVENRRSIVDVDEIPF